MRFFVIHRHESVTSIHVSPHPAIPFSPLSTPYPPGLSQSTSFGALLHVSNLHWSSVLHMVMYMFQCYSLKSSHPRLLPLSPKVCSLHLCLLCFPAYRIISTVFSYFCCRNFICGKRHCFSMLSIAVKLTF